MSARRQKPREFADRLMRILNVFQAFETSDVLKFPIQVRQNTGQIAAPHFNLVMSINLYYAIAAGIIILCVIFLVVFRWFLRDPEIPDREYSSLEDNAGH